MYCKNYNFSLFGAIKYDKTFFGARKYAHASTGLVFGKV